jgi:hypothetical protein
MQSDTHTLILRAIRSQRRFKTAVHIWLRCYQQELELVHATLQWLLWSRSVSNCMQNRPSWRAYQQEALGSLFFDEHSVSCLQARCCLMMYIALQFTNHTCSGNETMHIVSMGTHL